MNLTRCYGLIATGEDLAVHEFYFGPRPDDVSWTSEPVTFGGSTRDDVAASLQAALLDIMSARVTIVDNEISIADPGLDS